MPGREFLPHPHPNLKNTFEVLVNKAGLFIVSSLKGTVTTLVSTLVCLLTRQQDGGCILFRLCCVLSIGPSPLMQDPGSGSFMSQ